MAGHSLPFLRTAALAALLAVPAPAASEPVPVVVAVDTSRSLAPAELRGVTDTLADVVGALPSTTPTALLAFDDEPRWIVPLPATPSEVAAALPGLRPRGDYTLLHDALFVASRDLRDGGIVLVATDGRDENSATTVEDIGRLAEAQGVRILTLGIGRPLQEKALRRLALLTQGEHLGSADATQPASLSESLRETGDAISSARADERTSRTSDLPPAAAPPPPPAPIAVPPPVAPASSVPERGLGDVLWGLVAVGALAVALILGFLLVRGQSRSRSDGAPTIYCERCGTEITEEGAACPHCASTELRRELLDSDVAQRREIWEITGDTAIVEDPTLAESLDKTRVLAEQHVLAVRARGEETRTFVLSPLKAFGVGRQEDGGNTLALLDPALSAHHFRVVPRDGHYHLLDLGSTNGTWVDGERLEVPRSLRPGDRFRAGRIEFEFQTHLPGF